MLTDMQKREFIKDFTGALETVSKRERETGIDAAVTAQLTRSEFHIVEFHFEAVLLASFKAQ